MNITISKQLPPVSITPASPSVMHAMEMSQKEMPDRPDKNASSFLAQWLLPVTMLLLLGSVIAAYRLHPEFEALRQEKMHTAWGSILLIAGGILIVLQLCFLLYILTL